MDSKYSKEDSYWAEGPEDELVKNLVVRRKAFAEFMQRGPINRIARNWNYFHGFYGGYNDSQEMAIKSEDEEGSRAIANCNHFRSLVNQYITYVVSNKPSWDSRAIKDDFRSREEAKLFNNLLDAYMEIGGAENDLRRAATHAFVLSAGFCYVHWNWGKGRPIRPDETGNVLYEGDLDFLTPTILDVSWDLSVPDFEDIQSTQIRCLRNRWDLVKLYPQHRDKILDAPPANKSVQQNDYQSYGQINLASEYTDLIEVYDFWHSWTPALPKGRHCEYICDEYSLTTNNPEGPINPYKILPLARLVPDEYILTNMGYTSAFDMQVPQEWFGANLSSALTRLNLLEQVKIWEHLEDDPHIDELEPGSAVKVIRSRIKPEILDWLSGHVKELYDGLAVARSEIEFQAGIGPVSRGHPEGELKGASGAAFALLDSKSIQSTSVFQTRYNEFKARVGTIALKVLQAHANSERVIALVGKKNKARMVNWSAEDIAGIDRVVVEAGSPLQRSLAGKVQIADAMRESGLVTTPQEYLTVIETGQVDPLTSSLESQLSIISDENERLRQNYEQFGQLIQAMQGTDNMMVQEQIRQQLQQMGVVCLRTDNHILHLRRNSTIVDSTEARMIPGIVVPVTAHLAQHLDFIKDPEVQREQLLMGYISGPQLQEFIASMQIPMAAMAAQGPPAPPGGPPGGPPGPPGGVSRAMAPQENMPEQPLPMSETGIAPKAKRIPQNAVKEAVAAGVQQP
jgi:hypothetical protein